MYRRTKRVGEGDRRERKKVERWNECWKRESGGKRTVK